MSVEELLQVAIIVNILAATIRIATPLLLTALGELVTERAGILNLGLEGMMLMGAFISFLVAHQTGSTGLALAAAVAVGAIMALISAIMTITLKVDQVVTGMAINLFGSGMSLFWYRSVFGEFATGEMPTITMMQNVRIPLLSDIPYLGEILFSHRILTYLAFLAVPAIWFFLYRTKYGLLIRGLGEKHHFTLMCRDLSEIATYARVGNVEYRFLRQYTPGPYTFILQATHEVPRRLQHPKRKTVGLRVPGHPLTQALLAALGEPLLSTSLILPDESEPLCDPYDIDDRIGNRVELILDVGFCADHPTTVIDLSGGTPVLVRRGRGEVPAGVEEAE